MNGIDRTKSRFGTLRDRSEVALIPYLVAGHPTWRSCKAALWQAQEAGADLVELGIPFSDPVADGPVIAHAAHEAVARGVTPRACLQFVKSLRDEGFELPMYAMTYANVVFSKGYAPTALAWARAGLDGGIVPDVPIEHAAPLRKAFLKAGLANVFFVAPSTGTERIRAVVAQSTGFVYVVGVYGTTGVRARLSSLTTDLVRRVRDLTPEGAPPACTGFGVGRPEHVRALREAGAGGVIVGSACVERVAQGRDLGPLLRRLKAATRATAA
jgi:tryptophan synthase alpha chain